MRKLLFIAVLTLLAVSLFAGGAENKNNFSAGYARILSKNTETSKPDAVFYNPAGTAFMEDGIYVEAANQFLFKEYSNNAKDISIASQGFGDPTDMDKYTSDNPVLLYPSAELVWKKDDFAIFGSFGVFAGGGTLEYDKGSFLTNSQFLSYVGTFPGPTTIEEEDIEHSLEASSVTFGEMIGASYKYQDIVSASAAVRFLQGKLTQKVTLDNEPTTALITVAGLGGITIEDKTMLDTEASANGVGFIFGTHVKPIEKLDIALQYQTRTKMEYEYDKAKGALVDVEKGDKFKTYLPAVFAMGVGYQILPALYASTSFNYYFNDQADFDYDDSWEIALGAEYDINEMIAVSAGGMYSKQGLKDDTNSTENPLLDSVTIGLGAGLNFIENLTVDIGLMKPIYFDADLEYGDEEIKLSKKLTILAIGATYRF